MTQGANNRSITPDARPGIEELGDFALQPGVLAALRQAQAEAVAVLRRAPDLSSTFVTLDPVRLGAAVPPSVGTIRVAVSRAGADTAVERHPNSTQILFVLDGPVETHVETGAGWRVDRYGEGSASVLENRWHLVPPGVWHKSNAPGPGDCAVVAFHSAREVEDEYR